MKNKPLVFGGLSLMLGYTCAWILPKAEPNPAGIAVYFTEREQLARIRRVFSSRKGQEGVTRNT